MLTDESLRRRAAGVTRSVWRRLREASLWQWAAVVLMVTAVGAAAAHPLSFGAMPDTPDGELHLYRLIAFDHGLRHGAPLPRYTPGLLFGYGYPIFNYYAPLVYYLLEALHLLGLNFLHALLAGLVILAIFGGVGAYLLGRAWFGPVAGAVTAVAYLYAPYTLYNSPRRGAVGEFAGLMLMPWILFAFVRLAKKGRGVTLAGAALGYAALIATHNIGALIFTPLLLTYVAMVWWLTGWNRPAGWRLGTALVLGLGLAAIYWLPALIETRYVQIERVYAPAALDFHNQFLPLGEIFGPLLTADLTQLHPPIPRSLSWPGLILGMVGLGLAWMRPAGGWPGGRAWAALMSVWLAGLIFGATRASAWLWEALPLVRFVQFPWRLLGPAGLALAGLAGAGAEGLCLTFTSRPVQAQSRLRQIWPGPAIAFTCAAAIILYGLPWLYVQFLPAPAIGGILDAQHFERRTGWIGTTSTGEYLPVAVEQLPDPARLEGLYAQSEVIPRLPPQKGVQLIGGTWGTTSAEVRLRLDESRQVRFDWLYFPGWRAWVDGQAIPVGVEPPHGFLAVHVPSGEHDVRLNFGPTRLRLGAGIASAVSLLAVTGLSVVAGAGYGESPARPTWRTFAPLAGAALAGLALVGLKIGYFDGANTPIKRARFAEGVEAGLQTPSGADFGGQLRLLGYDVLSGQVRSGQPLRLALYWELAGGMVAENYSSGAYLADPSGNVIVQTGAQHPGDWPTSEWVPGFYVQDRLTLDVPPGTPPGTYTLHVGVYSPDLGRNLDVLNQAGNPSGATAAVGQVEVLRPRRPPRPADLDMALRLDAPLTREVALLGAALPITETGVGQTIPLALYWQVHHPPGEDWTLRPVWLDGERVAAISPDVALTAGYPTGQWRRGEVLKGLYALRVPGALESSTYSLTVQLVGADGQSLGEQVEVGQVKISAPERSYDVPYLPSEAGVEWANGTTLLGYALPRTRLPAQGELRLTLYWQPSEEVPDDLKVFVHVLSYEGRLVAQRDQAPVGGERPTTGWAPGEVIADRYVIPLPPDVGPGVYRVQVGWYDASTGARVLLPGGDTWTLPKAITVTGS
jgi:hypothetical protein